jgi:hypothetical protein
MAKVVEILRFIAAILIGAGLAYFWYISYPDIDFTIIVGVFIGTTAISAILLHFIGRGSGGG